MVWGELVRCWKRAETRHEEDQCYRRWRTGERSAEDGSPGPDWLFKESVRPQPVSHLLNPKSPSTHVLPDMVEDERGMPNMNKKKLKQDDILSCDLYLAMWPHHPGNSSNENAHWECSIVFVRVFVWPPEQSSSTAQAQHTGLSLRAMWAGCFTVVDSSDCVLGAGPWSLSAVPAQPKLATGITFSLLKQFCRAERGGGGRETERVLYL